MTPIWSEGDPVPKGYRMGKDRLPARNQGPWARDKLSFLDAFEGPALIATKKKKGQCHYVDLFAGPGLTVSDADIEYTGSPIRALYAEGKGKGWTGRFRGFHFCNIKPLDHELLERRIDIQLAIQGERDLRTAIRHDLADCNEAVDSIMKRIPQIAYVLAFADPEGPKDLAFSTIERLKRDHASVDLYVLYPTFLGMERNFEYNRETRAKYRPTYDRYFGTDEWWDIVEQRKTERDAVRMRGALKNLYVHQLRKHWEYVEEVLQVRMDSGKRLYDMLFAHSHPAAGSIAKSAKRRSGELDMFDGTEHARGLFRKT